MLLMKTLLRVVQILEVLPRLTPSSPPRRVRPRKERKREKEKINLNNLNRNPPNLQPRKELSANPNILASFVRRITTLRTALGGPKLVVC